MRGYSQLTVRDRLLIEQLKAKGVTQAAIARRIGKHPSTISRELRRNATVVTAEHRFFYERIGRQLFSEAAFERFLETQPAGMRETVVSYDHAQAQDAAQGRARLAQIERRAKRPETDAWIVERLHLGWSPQQIAGRSKSDGPQSVSHEYVYRLVHRSKKSGGRLHRLLKRFGKRKQRFNSRDYTETPPPTDRVSIDERPAIVDERARLGDCEADLIVGYKQSGYILSVVDRVSRAVVLRKLSSKRMSEVGRELMIALAMLGILRTLTVDNGKEFYCHKLVTATTGIPVYFTHPYCSTERGSIENVNGLVRYYLPKRTSFAALTQERLDEIACLLNERPRRCLGYLTPIEVQSKNNRLCTLPRVALVG